MRYLSSRSLLLALFFVIALSSFVLAVSGDIELSYILIQGNPQIMKAGTDKWIELTVDTAITHGDRIKTAQGDEVELTFASDDDKNVITIEEDSDIYIKIGKAARRIDIVNGAAVVLIKGMNPSKNWEMISASASQFEVRTPTAVSGARGTGWRSAGTSESSSFSCFDKSISVRGIDETGNVMPDALVVENGFKTMVDKFEKPSRIERLSQAEMDRLNEARQEMSKRMESTGAESGDSDSSDDSGRNRLDNMDAMNERTVEQMDSLKSDVNEARDMERIKERVEERQEPSGGGGGGPV